MSVETMSFAEMEKYQGTNPKPGDFETFWERGLAQAREAGASCELVPAKFQVPGAECFHLFFSGVDGARIHAKYLRPFKTTEKHPVIFMFHGYTGDSGDWWYKLAWVQQGFAVVAMDCRGQAGSSQDLGGVHGTTYMGHLIRGLADEPERLFYRQVFLDIAILVQLVRRFPEIDEDKMMALGGSQGGALALVCAALTPDIKRVAVEYPFLCDYKRAWDMDCADSAYEELKAFFRAHDPLHEREKEIFHKLGYIDVQFFTPWVRAEVLWGMGMKDGTCPPSTQFAAYNHLTAPKRLMLYQDYKHEVLPRFLDQSLLFFGEF